MVWDLTGFAVGIATGLLAATPVALFLLFSRQARQQRDDLPLWMNRNQPPGEFPSLITNLNSLSDEQFQRLMANSAARKQWTVVEGRRLEVK